MRIKKRILDGVLYAVNRIVCLRPIREDQVTFVSLESNELEQDMLQIYNEIKAEYEVKTVLMRFRQNNLWTNFLYMLNTIKQIWCINQSSVVIISDNNYVVSRFKREGVQVIQVWHAAGAIKQFGNCIHREYKIMNYDYVIANSKYWAKPYSQAFGVCESQVKILGMPRIDRLFDEEYKRKATEDFYQKYPQLAQKKLILYAPTFRGNIHQGIHGVEMDAKELLDTLGEDYVLLYKYHPLLERTVEPKHTRCVNVTEEELYELLIVSTMMISDYSSIIFDYSLLEKPILCYAPDQEEYGDKVGYFVDYATIPAPICRTTEEIGIAIKNIEKQDQKGWEVYRQKLCDFQGKYFEYRDGNNTKRVVEFLDELIKN